MGRRSKYTPETSTKILNAIRMGATYELAANYAGITYETFRNWQAEKPAFFSLVKEAEGVGAIGWLAKIEQAASDGSWQAAAWKLERRYPSLYGRTVQEQTGNVRHEHSGSIHHRDLRLFTDEEVKSMAAIAERAKAERALTS